MFKIPHYSFRKINRILLSAVIFLALVQCAEDTIAPEDAVYQTAARAIIDNVSPASCTSCTYTIPSNASIIDGAAFKPGSVICFNAANTYNNYVFFKNIKGTADSPIIITNCGGTATINAWGKNFGIMMENSQHFKISGGSATTYGIKINGGHIGITLANLSSDFEIDHVEIASSGFAGIMAKTDPTCDNATIRGLFTMKNISLHDNYIRNTGGEALYIGHSSYTNGVSLSCGVRLPHTIENLKIYNNKIMHAGWEAIQVGCTPTGAYVYNNTIESFGTKNVQYQNNAIQFSEGAKAICYNNYIKTGPGTGINIIGHGDALLYNNIIVNVGGFGIFADERITPGAGMKILNNTIIYPKQDGIRLYTELVPLNIVKNNIIVDPGSFSTYTYPRTGNDAYVHLLNNTMPVEISNNYFTRDINTVKFVNPWAANYRLTSYSPAINKGADISLLSITTDFYTQPRLNGTAFDIGASEY